MSRLWFRPPQAQTGWAGLKRQGIGPFSLIVFLLPIALLLPLASIKGGELDSLSAVRETIRDEDLREHIGVLASDAFEGREAGTRGGKAAGIYIVEKLKNMGVLDKEEAAEAYQEFGQGYRNVLCVIPGSHERLKEEYILIGAHYDHVGYGTWRNSQGPIGRIHNGADDNASGVAGLLELAEAFASLETRPRRSLLLAFWDAEEKGLLGSKHWVRNPTVPLQQVRFVLNTDMMGRLEDRRLEVYGVRTARGLRRLVSKKNRGLNFLLDFHWGIKGNSDHYPFYQNEIPFLMLHTGKHYDYHRPSDDYDKVNMDGAEQIARMLFQIVWELAQAEEVPAFRPSSRKETEVAQKRLSEPLPGLRPRFGVSWSGRLERTEGVVRLTSVTPGSPADRAGLQRGDRIIRFAGRKLKDVKDFRSLVLRAENPVSVLVRRSGSTEPVELTVELAGSPIRLGVSCRKDEAEPGCVILNRVVPDSAADRAGLQVNDRVYEIAGAPLKSPGAFREAVASAEAPVELVVERQGRVRTVELNLSETETVSLPVETTGRE